MKMNAKLFDFIKNSPTAYHSCNTAADILTKNGYTELFEGEKWTLKENKGYFVKRNGSSVARDRNCAVSL